MRARGILHHHFWGTYSAGIQLVFCKDVDAPRSHEVAAARTALAALNAEPEVALLSGSEQMTPIGGTAPTDKGWRLAEKCSAALVISVDSAGVDLVERQLRRHGLEFLPCGWSHCPRGGEVCEASSIGGTPHSVDHGPPFTVEVDVQAARQISMFEER